MAEEEQQTLWSKLKTALGATTTAVIDNPVSQTIKKILIFTTALVLLVLVGWIVILAWGKIKGDQAAFQQAKAWFTKGLTVFRNNDAKLREDEKELERKRKELEDKKNAEKPLPDNPQPVTPTVKIKPTLTDKEINDKLAEKERELLGK